MTDASEVERIKVTLENQAEWAKLEKIHEIRVGTDGRLFKPALTYKVEGLVPGGNYAMIMNMVTTDDHKYRYNRKDKKYEISSKLEVVNKVSQFSFHPNMFQSGEKWMSAPFTFKKIKIAPKTKVENMDIIHLNVRHRYMPHVTVVKEIGEEWKPLQFFAFPNTDFVAVAHLQRAPVNQRAVHKRENQEVSELEYDSD